MTESLHTKYRPTSFGEVVGQREVVASLRKMLTEKARPHSFLLTGPSGCGKTTIARILAREFECLPNNITEADAATNNGIDDMRNIIETLRYIGFGESNKMVIIDECHALSKAAWQSLLKSIEEPPAHVFFALCTTDAGKVPDTIKTRCATYNLKEVKRDDIWGLLDDVCKEEGLDTQDSILDLVARSCNGSPRQALVQLAMVKNCDTKEDAALLLETPLENKEVIDLCRKLLDRQLCWKDAVGIIKALPDTPPESVRIIIVNYLSACLLNPKSEKDVPRLLNILDSFSKPCNPTDKWAPILLALGDHIFGGG